MTDIDLDLDGLQSALDAVDDLQDDWGDSDAQYLVGTGVEYGIYLEVGTRNMDPKPFVRPAVDNVAARVEQIVADADAADEAVARVAFSLEREIKQIITEKGLIDTGTLRASVVAIRGLDPAALPDAADFDDPGDGLVPPDAGRRLASRTVEVS
jgi:hypothetical protein